MTRRRILAALLLLAAAGLAGDFQVRATGNLEVIALSGSAIGNRAWDPALFPLPWYFHNPTSYPACAYSSFNAPVGTLQPAHVAAFSTWQANPLSTVTYTYAGTTTVRDVGADGVNLMTFCDSTVLGSDQGFLARTPTTALTEEVTITAGGGCPTGQGLLDLNGPPPPSGFCFPAGTYAAGAIVDADVEYNTYSGNEQDFSTNGAVATYDVQSIATHELGHWIGLSHDPITDAVMFPFIDDEPASDGVGERVLKESDKTTAGRYYPSTEFQSNRGSITGIVTLDGSRADGVHVVAIDPNTLRAVTGRFSVSRFEDPNALGPEGADFAANGAGHYRIDGLLPGGYYVYVEYFDGSEFFSDRLANRYNTTVGNSSVATGGSAGYLGFLPRLAEFYNTGDSGNGGDGVSPGTAADNSDAAALVTVSAGAETSGIDIAINVEPVNGQAPADRENPTTRTLIPNDDLGGGPGDTITGFLLNGGDDDYYSVRFPASALPSVPYNVAEGLFIRAGLNTTPYPVMLAFEDASSPGFPDMDDPIIPSADRVLTGGVSGATAAGDFIDVRDQWNVTINQSRDLFIVLKQPDSPAGITYLTEGYFYLLTRTSSSTCRVCRTSLTQNGGATFSLINADLFYDLIVEEDPPVMVNSVSPSVLEEGTTADVDIFGAGFQSGAAVDFGPDVVVNSVILVSPTQLTANLTVNLTGAVATRDVTVAVINPEVVFPTVARVFSIDPTLDTDGDGTPDGQDCDPLDGLVEHPATEVAGFNIIHIGGQLVRLEWDSQDSVNGLGTRYDIVRGYAGDLIPDGGFASSVCASDNTADTPFATAAPLLSPGELVYFLINAYNTCNSGPGSYGDGNMLPDPRDVLDASPPCSSP